MITGKTLLLAAVLVAAPFTTFAASAQNPRTNPSNTTMQQRDRMAIDRNQTNVSDMHDQHMRVRGMRHRYDRDMRHYGWRRGHHYGWRHCTTRWHDHHRVRVCR